jgi:uncharacterized C2H2 Zn-finger protein
MLSLWNMLFGSTMYKCSKCKLEYKRSEMVKGGDEPSGYDVGTHSIVERGGTRLNCPKCDVYLTSEPYERRVR